MLQLTYDVFTGSITVVDATALKRGRTERIGISVLDNGSPINGTGELASGRKLKVAFKPSKLFDPSKLVFTLTLNSTHWDAQRGAYVATANYITTELNDLFGIGDVATDIKDDVALIGDVTQLDGSDDEISQSKVFAVSMTNNVGREEDGTPSAAASPDADWLAHGHSQSLTDAQKVRAQSNLGFAYDASKGGFVVTYANGATGFIPILQVPA